MAFIIIIIFLQLWKVLMSAMLKIISNSLKIRKNVLNTSHFTGENIQSFKDVLSYRVVFFFFSL